VTLGNWRLRVFATRGADPICRERVADWRCGGSGACVVGYRKRERVVACSGDPHVVELYLRLLCALMRALSDALVGVTMVYGPFCVGCDGTCPGEVERARSLQDRCWGCDLGFGGDCTDILAGPMPVRIDWSRARGG